MKFSQPSADLYAPGGKDPWAGLSSTTHLGIGAHADDLEILAFPGIAACFQHPKNRFSGIVVTDGAGAPRSGPFAQTSDVELIQLRRAEQRRAADLGHYASVIQLAHPSPAVRQSDRSAVIGDLVKIFEAAQPQTLYLHNPADRHETHIAVLLACIEALRQLPESSRPKEIYGCEVWGDLDWVPSSQVVRLPCPAPETLGTSLLDCFQSQIAGGKRYDRAALGRRYAQATFGNPNQPDSEQEIVLALDLRPLLDTNLSLQNFLAPIFDLFRTQTLARIDKLAPSQ
ncbi:MAG: PIG-L family deacetylase [Proteobacteria bacterium]|nr:PIG-L family deacetylase [Pseudomonadota bacterium]NBS06303.1 PIG-L family deacetylase [Verrucomicrobiota bacterium]